MLSEILIISQSENYTDPCMFNIYQQFHANEPQCGKFGILYFPTILDTLIYISWVQCPIFYYFPIELVLGKIYKLYMDSEQIDGIIFVNNEMKKFIYIFWKLWVITK